MTQKNIIYYFEECMLTVELIAEKTGLSVEAVEALLVTQPVHIPSYAPRQRRAMQDHVKPF